MAALNSFEPFFFRTFTDDGSGIMYLAHEPFRNEACDCMGARRVGTHDSRAVWYIAARMRGGYSDVMPEAAMFDRHPVSEIAPHDNQKEIKHPAEGVTLYFDGKSYWFVDNELVGKKKERSKSVTRTARKRSKSRGK